jgi:hypothetical protein
MHYFYYVAHLTYSQSVWEHVLQLVVIIQSDLLLYPLLTHPT